MKQNKIQNFSFFLLLKFFFSFQICSFYVWLNWNWTLWFASIRFTLDFLSVGKTIGARLMLYLGKTKSISLIGNNKSFKDEFETCQFRDWFEQKKRNNWEILLVHWRGRHIWVARASKFDVQFFSSLVLSNSPCYGQALHATCVNRAFWFFFGESLFFSFFLSLHLNFYT